MGQTYTLSYTFTVGRINYPGKPSSYDRLNLTQNQVVETSCWFESGQGHQEAFSDSVMRRLETGRLDPMSRARGAAVAKATTTAIAWACIATECWPDRAPVSGFRAWLSPRWGRQWDLRL